MNRRRRNRKLEPAALLVSARLVMVLAMAGVLAILYLGLCGHCENLGRDIKKLEQELENVRTRIRTEEYKWSRLTSPRRFQQILAEHGIQMEWPEENRVVRLPSSSVRPYERDVAQSYALAQSTPPEHHD